MCGISAVTGHDNIVPVLYQSIKNLEYRGYDSCGLSVVNHGELAVRKNVGGVQEVNDKEHLTGMIGSAGIAHTRWATHGRVTQLNAHPHTSMDGRFSLVHNGIINNYQHLREELKARKIEFISDTDTEVLAHLIALAYKDLGDVEQAFLSAVRRVEGSNAFCMISSVQPDTLYCMRNGSPLVLGLGVQRNFIASDVNAFLEYTREAVPMEDGEYAVLTPAEAHLRKVADSSPVLRGTMHIEWDAETSRKGGYAHYMLKEIFEQPQTITNALNVPLPDIAKMAGLIQAAATTYLTGVGTTHYVAMTGQYLFSRIAGRYLPAISADEFNDLAVVDETSLVLAMSQSGETYDTRRAVAFAKAGGARTASIVNVMGSSLSLLTDEVIMQGSGREVCVVSTKAALAQIILLQRIALELGRMEGRMSEAAYAQHYQNLQALPTVVEAALNERSGFVRNLANTTARYRSWLIMGRGVYHAMALEAALKTKEVTYLHVEGMPAGFLKHGTLSLVDESVLSVFLLPPPEEAELHKQTLSAVEEVLARGGPVVAICSEGDVQVQALVSQRIEVPRVPPDVAPLMHLIMAQLYAYFTALKLGRSIDKPRNLAKSVTVG